MIKLCNLKKTALLIAALNLFLIPTVGVAQDMNSEETVTESSDIADSSASKEKKGKKSDESSESTSEESKEPEIVKMPEKSKLEIAQEKAEKKLRDAEEKAKRREEKKALKEQAKIAKQLAKDKLREKKDTKLGIVYVPEKSYQLKSGKLRIVLAQKTGSFNIFAKGEGKEETALFSNIEGSVSTFFSAKIGNTIYRLNKDAGVNKELRRLGSGAQLAFSIENKMQVAVDFTTVASVMGIPDDMVKVTVFVSNISDKPQDIGIKGVFDTILGEGTDYHFISSAGRRINGEKQFYDFKKDRAVVSTNGKTSLQIVLDGSTVTPVECISFANRDSLEASAWIPVIVDSRSFNSVLAYNNSSVSVNWPVEKYAPGETKNIVFFLAAGTDHQMPNGLAFVDNIENKNGEAAVEFQEIDKKELEVKKPEVDFVVPQVTDKQLDPEYIQNLINKINSLQSDPATVNRNEVRQLSAELDAIMKKMRQQ